MNFTGITDDDRRRWQRATLAGLLDLLTTHSDLPVVAWRIAPGQRAVAQLNQFDGTPARQRAVVDAYALALGVDVEVKTWEAPPAGFRPGEQIGRMFVLGQHQRAEVLLSAPLTAPESGVDQ